MLCKYKTITTKKKLKGDINYTACLTSLHWYKPIPFWLLTLRHVVQLALTA